ncbi:MAG: ABC transporter permease [Ruminococcaceae bacterium]|mgnify:CR=1 FL=1|nr:ABC transporter permease [Oscillospiraceae bacterium]
MKRKLKSITTKLSSWSLIIALLVIWQLVSTLGLVPDFMLPSPVNVVLAFIGDFGLLMENLWVTLYEALAGLALAVAASFVLAILMDLSGFLKRSVTPILTFTQTVPTIALAPLLLLWMGYGAAPKIVLVFITCFFPLTISLMGSFAQADGDAIRLLKTMGASRLQVYRYIKLPSALPAFFSGLRIAATYSVVGAVVGEWLGGNAGLGVYMIRVRKSYNFDKMFAVILLISILSIVLIKLVELLEYKAMPWRRKDKKRT